MCVFTVHRNSLPAMEFGYSIFYFFSFAYLLKEKFFVFLEVKSHSAGPYLSVLKSWLHHATETVGRYKNFTWLDHATCKLLHNFLTFAMREILSAEITRQQSILCIVSVHIARFVSYSCL